MLLEILQSEKESRCHFHISLEEEKSGLWKGRGGGGELSCFVSTLIFYSNYKQRHTMIVQGVVSVILDFNDPQKKLGFE